MSNTIIGPKEKAIRTSKIMSAPGRRVRNKSIREMPRTLEVASILKSSGTSIENKGSTTGNSRGINRRLRIGRGKAIGTSTQIFKTRKSRSGRKNARNGSNRTTLRRVKNSTLTSFTRI